MPYSGQLLNEFLALGAEGFLSTYALKSNAGGGARTANAQELYATSPNPGVNPAHNVRLTSVTGGLGRITDPGIGGPVPAPQIQIQAAPRVFAYFTFPEAPAFPHPIFKASVSIWFDNAANLGGVAGLPCFLVPSAMDRAIGIQIPAHVGGDPIHVFTTTQDGCSFRISGPFAQPYLSHTNAFSSPPAMRPAALLARLNLLQTAMNGGAAAGPADPFLAEFALLPTDGSESQRDQSRRLLQFSHNHQQKYRRSLAVGHKNYYWSVHADTVNAINGGWKPATSLIIGAYDAGSQVWNFAYQECGDLKISEFTRRKVGAVTLSQSAARDLTAQSIFVSGHFWPGMPTETPFPV